ncbi:MAG: magnesium transporter [Sulfurimonas sp.]|uniref:CorA family divalent cation transporter n=1 Tax=Sulfurimonas sp. TaxID=2022749 RepID=UPI0025EB7307|nr:CorA family divalent cation transporter [Sulfurimonas sp.]MCK9490613.1 magnesium transporter [Sulfurimonas sp.]
MLKNSAMLNIKESLDKLHLEDLKNEIHPSLFDVNDEYDLLIVRLPIVEDELKFSSVGFIITQEDSFLYDRSSDELTKLDDKFVTTHNILNKIIDNLLKAFERYRETIADIEEDLYDNQNIDSFMKKWLELKRDILRIERVLMHTAETMDEMIEHYETKDNFPINNFINLHEHLDRTLRSATLQYSKLDYLYSFYTARINDKMNHLIYTLTIISAIFLPLNLIVGFFGINTSGLPFTNGSSGTLGVLSIMVFVFLLSALVINFVRKRGKSF